MNKIPYAAIRKNIMNTPSGPYRTKMLKRIDAVQEARFPQRAEIRVYDRKFPVKATLEYSGKKITGKATTEESSQEYYRATAVRDLVLKTPWLMKQYLAGEMEVFDLYKQVPNRVQVIATRTDEIMHYISDVYEISQYKDRDCTVYLLNKR